MYNVLFLNVIVIIKKIFLKFSHAFVSPKKKKYIFKRRAYTPIIESKEVEKKSVPLKPILNFIIGLIVIATLCIFSTYSIVSYFYLPLLKTAIGETLYEKAYRNAVNKNYGNDDSYVLQGYDDNKNAVIVIKKELNEKLKKEIFNAVDLASKKYGVEKKLIHAIIAVESNYNPFAVSTKNCKGLMQLKPETAKNMGVEEIFDIKQNIDGGTRYISQLLKKFNDIRLAIAAYNAGPTAVTNSRGVPPYEETQNYVKKVIKIYNSL